MKQNIHPRFTGIQNKLLFALQRTRCPQPANASFDIKFIDAKTRSSFTPNYSNHQCIIKVHNDYLSKQLLESLL